MCTRAPLGKNDFMKNRYELATHNGLFLYNRKERPRSLYSIPYKLLSTSNLARVAVFSSAFKEFSINSG